MPASSPHAHARHQIQVAALCGSLRAGSYTRMALEIALRGAREVGAQTRLLDLNDYDLPFCRGKAGDDAAPAEVVRLRKDLRQAHGIIIGTPEYHGSFSGVLKNALDQTGFDEFEGKLVGLVGVCGGRLGAINALNGLHAVGRALHAWIVPEQASVPDAWKQFDADGTLKNAELETRLLGVGRQVARFAFLHTSSKTREFLEAWEHAMPNPGGGHEVELVGE